MIDLCHSLTWAIRKNNAEWVGIVTTQLGNDITELPKLKAVPDDDYLPLAFLYDREFMPRLRVPSFEVLCSTLTNSSSTTVAHEHNLAHYVRAVVWVLCGRHGPPVTSYRSSQSKEVAMSSAGGGWSSSSKLSRVQIFHHLFVWSVLMAQPELARVFWQNGGHSIQNALMACQMLKRMASLTVFTNSLQFQADRKRFLALADDMEQAACGVLAQCYQANERRTAALLACPYEAMATLPESLRSYSQSDNTVTTCLHHAADARAMKLFSQPAVNKEVRWTVWEVVAERS